MEEHQPGDPEFDHTEAESNAQRILRGIKEARQRYDPDSPQQEGGPRQGETQPDVQEHGPSEPERDLILDGQTGMISERMPDGSRKDVTQAARQVWN